jgi:hypothetical protein
VTPGYPAVVTIGRRKQWKEGECHSTKPANAAADADPIMSFVMRLLAPPTMTDDRIGQTNWTLPEKKLGASDRPVNPKLRLVLNSRKWDKDDHTGVKALPGDSLCRGRHPKRSLHPPRMPKRSSQNIRLSSEFQ